jgi:hypothetical protein
MTHIQQPTSRASGSWFQVQGRRLRALDQAGNWSQGLGAFEEGPDTPNHSQWYEAGGVVCKLRANVVVVDVACSVHENLVKLWRDGGLAVIMMARLFCEGRWVGRST